MIDIEEVSIDVRDIDYSWFEGVKAYLDRDYNLYHLPRESVERLGEVVETGDAELIDGHVAAKAEVIEFDGRSIEAWTIGCGDLVIRPASDRVRRDGSGIARG